MGVLIPDRPVGAHAPVAGGLAKAALPHIDAVAAEAVQVYVSNPRGWAQSPGDPAHFAEKVDGPFVVKMVQRQRRDNVINRSIRKRKHESAALHGRDFRKVSRLFDDGLR